MIDLDRMKQYIELGFSKEEALDLVKDEEVKAEAKEKEKDELLERIKKLEEKEPEADAKSQEPIIIENKDNTMTVEEAFKNIFK